jgi:hypothetical protein
MFFGIFLGPWSLRQNFKKQSKARDDFSDGAPIRGMERIFRWCGIGCRCCGISQVGHFCSCESLKSVTYNFRYTELQEAKWRYTLLLFFCAAVTPVGGCLPLVAQFVFIPKEIMEHLLFYYLIGLASLQPLFLEAQRSLITIKEELLPFEDIFNDWQETIAKV